MMNKNIYDVPTSTDQLISGNKMYLGSRAGQRMDCNGYLHLPNGSIWDGEGEENFGFPHTYQSGEELPFLNGIYS